MGGELKEVGQVFLKPLRKLYFLPLNMEPICISPYTLLFHPSLSHTNPMSLVTPLAHLKIPPTIVALCFGPFLK
jgi:hypothetical protein